MSDTYDDPEDDPEDDLPHMLHVRDPGDLLDPGYPDDSPDYSDVPDNRISAEQRERVGLWARPFGKSFWEPPRPTTDAPKLTAEMLDAAMAKAYKQVYPGSDRYRHTPRHEMVDDEQQRGLPTRRAMGTGLVW